MYSVDPTPTEVSKKLAKRHRAMRKQFKLSQTEMSERSGVSLGSLKRFENTGKISLESLLKLIHLLGRLGDFDDLLEEKDNPDAVKKLFSNNS